MKAEFFVPRTISAMALAVLLAAGTLVAGAVAAQAAPLPVGTLGDTSLTATTAASASAAARSAPSASTTTGALAASTAKHPTLRVGSSGAQVRTLQRRLNTLGYWTGTADGQFGTLTEQAVMALKKVAGLPRDGVVGPQVWKALAKGRRPKARSSSGHVIEIDKKRQVLKVVNNGRVSYTLNTSTGSGATYVSQGVTSIASTPSGHFTVYRQIDGYRHAALGVLYRPKYFNGGIAVHGASSVPGYAASHGCARVTNAAMNWIWRTNKMRIGASVWVY